MSQPTLANQTGRTSGPVQKQQTSIYTVMLIISFVCIVVACILLYVELRSWGSYPWWKTSEGTPTTSAFYSAPENPSLPRQWA